MSASDDAARAAENDTLKEELQRLKSLQRECRDEDESPGTALADVLKEREALEATARQLEDENNALREDIDVAKPRGSGLPSADDFRKELEKQPGHVKQLLEASESRRKEHAMETEAQYDEMLRYLTMQLDIKEVRLKKTQADVAKLGQEIEVLDEEKELHEHSHEELQVTLHEIEAMCEQERSLVDDLHQQIEEASQRLGEGPGPAPLRPSVILREEEEAEEADNTDAVAEQQEEARAEIEASVRKTLVRIQLECTWAEELLGALQDGGEDSQQASPSDQVKELQGNVEELKKRLAHLDAAFGLKVRNAEVAESLAKEREQLRKRADDLQAQLSAKLEREKELSKDCRLLRDAVVAAQSARQAEDQQWNQKAKDRLVAAWLAKNDNGLLSVMFNEWQRSLELGKREQRLAWAAAAQAAKSPASQAKKPDALEPPAQAADARPRGPLRNSRVVIDPEAQVEEIPLESSPRQAGIDRQSSRSGEDSSISVSRSPGRTAKNALNDLLAEARNLKQARKGRRKDRKDTDGKSDAAKGDEQT
eukprot:TRINITY_DN45372_c0_g1_i3.p1 TRINITY_DN45372_c0_g1~~TRINITY_DN45372_c0_g1_i3.p1  ORF type:complete len:538 (-),score=170.17 TRINITY_DN45372_c0_g1_i3:1256-2869(-)